MDVSVVLFVLHIVSIFCAKTQLYKIPLTSYNGGARTFDHLESPVWDTDTQSLLFVDTLQQNVHRLNVSARELYTKHIECGQVNVVSLVGGSRRLLLGVRAALYLLEERGAGDAALRLLLPLDRGLPDNVINEGKPDALGRFWTGTKGPQEGDDVIPNMATFYSVEHTDVTSARVQLRPVSISNGLAWALNNSVLYYIDSPTQKIEAFNFDLQKGDISARRTIIDISDYGFEDGIPDGMTIDHKDHLWVAIMFGGTVLRIDPDNKRVIDRYKIPMNRVTSLCWGGPDLAYLFITTSRDTSGNETQNAAIYILADSGSHGVLENKFRFDNADNY